MPRSAYRRCTFSRRSPWGAPGVAIHADHHAPGPAAEGGDRDDREIVLPQTDGGKAGGRVRQIDFLDRLPPCAGDGVRRLLSSAGGAENDLDHVHLDLGRSLLSYILTLIIDGTGYPVNIRRRADGVKMLSDKRAGDYSNFQN